MNTVFVRSVLLLGTIWLMACYIILNPSAAALVLSSNEVRHRVRLDQCIISHHGSELFVGVNKCFDGIPQNRFSGVWIAKLEQSVFVENASKWVFLKENPEQSTWLNIDVANAFKKAGITFDGTERQFLISFTGRKSVKRGFYGHMGQYRNGILVDNIFTIRPLRLGSGPINRIPFAAPM